MLQVPKHCLKSRKFQEECILSAIELLMVHFGQWRYHISFPELASIPLIRLRKFHATTIENLRHVVKRLIDQVDILVLNYVPHISRHIAEKERRKFFWRENFLLIRDLIAGVATGQPGLNLNPVCHTSVLGQDGPDVMQRAHPRLILLIDNSQTCVQGDSNPSLDLQNDVF